MSASVVSPSPGSPGVLVPALVPGALLVGVVATCVWAMRGSRRAAVIAGVDPDRDRRASVPEWFCLAVAAIGLPVDAATLWSVVRVVGPLASALVVVRSPPALGLAVASAGGLWVARRSRARSVAREDVPAVVAALASVLGSGASPAQAIVAVGGRPSSPAGRALAPVRGSVQRGATAQEALDRWADDLGDPRARLLADALAVAGASGGSQARALRGVGRTMREREALAREITALGAQARTSAVVLAVTPVVFTSVVALADGRVAAFLFTTPAGVACLLAGGVADAVGWWWMRRLVDGAA